MCLWQMCLEKSKIKIELKNEQSKDYIKSAEVLGS